MAIIIETCPKCGHDLMDEVICTYPPIPRKVCHNCGWSWEGKQEEIIRVPFSDNNNLIVDDLVDILKDYTTLNITDLTDNDVLNGNTIAKGVIHTENWGSTIGTFNQSPCDNCSNNPKNGGSGICHCTLGSPQIYC